MAERLQIVMFVHSVNFNMINFPSVPRRAGKGVTLWNAMTTGIAENLDSAVFSHPSLELDVLMLFRQNPTVVVV